MEIKQCSQCKSFLFISFFYYNSNRNHYFSKCKKCINKNFKIENDKKIILRLKTHQKFLEENNLIGKKKCPQCKKWKDLEQFSFKNGTTDKLDCWCRDCKNKRHDIWYYETKEKKQKEYQQFLEKNNLIGKKLCKKCKEWKISEKFTKLFKVCDKCILKREKEYYKNHKKYFLNLSKEWRKKNRERYNILIANRCRQQYRTNPKFKLNDNISCAMRQSLKNGSGKGNRHWESLVPYNLSQLKRHLARTMLSGYSWQDFLDRKLHIDHKTPISAFNFTSLQHIDFQRCWALSNLQLLPAKKNISKGAKLLDHFQTCFQI